MNWTAISLKQIRKFFQGKIGWLRILAIALSGLFYYFIVDFYDKKFNVFDYVGLFSKNYNFYSGRDGGMYFQVGEGLTKIDSNKNVFFNYFFDINTKNKQTNGGYENPLSVLTTNNSFGLVEDDIYPNTDVIRKQLNYISPLYLERMHILFKQTDFVKEMSISSYTDEKILRYLSTARISTGPIGGGTKILASYIINELNNQIKETNKGKADTEKIKFIGENLVNLKIDEGYNALDSSRIEVMCLIAGTPLERVQGFLLSNKFGLASIEPSFTSDISKKYQLDLRITDFKRVSDKTPIYTNISNDKVATFGTYCYLITNKNTPVKHIKRMLKKLKKLEELKGSSMPLEEFQFLDIYENSGESSMWIVGRNILLFITSVLLSAIAIVTLTVWGISKLKHDSYVDDLAEIAKDIPNNKLPKTEINKYEEYKKIPDDEKIKIKEYLHPEILENQVSVITLKIVPSIHTLIIKRDELTHDFSEGVLTDEHYSFLMNRVDDLINKFRKALGIRFNEMIEKDKSILNNDLKSILRKYCTAEYLNIEDYEKLKNK